MADSPDIRDLSPPGEILAEALEERSMSSAELSRRTGLSEKHVSQVMNAKATLSYSTALLLERVLQIPATFWMNLEVAYRAEQQRAAERSALRDFAGWMRSFPFREMVRFGYVADVGQAAIDRVEALLRFFGVATPDAWQAAWAPVTARFRKSPTFHPNRHALTAWLRLSELNAQQIDCAPYDESRFSQAVSAIRGMTRLPAKEFAKQAVAQCSAAGVALTFTPSLPRLSINGATRWFGPKRAAIHLSLRGRTDDQMWFSLFHEACHVLEHSSQAIFIDDAHSYSGDDPVEARANEFARDKLIPPEQYQEFREQHPAPSKRAAAAFADQIGIAPGIVAGRLQHDRVWPHSHGNQLKRKFTWGCE